MNREDIIRMAREADREWDCDRDMVEWLEWFAALVAAAEQPTKPCRSPYCECDPGKCTHPGFYDARGEQPAQQREPVAWVDLLKEAEKIVRGKVLWKRFIDGTPLANDIAVWMADFAQQHTSPQPAHDCYRSHPHEDMDAMCELRTEIARLTNENARLKAQNQDDEINAYRMTLLCIRDGLQRGMSKSIQKLQAREINDVLGLPSFASYRTSPPANANAGKPWVGLTDEDIRPMCKQDWVFDTVKQWSQIIEAKLREKNK